MRELGLSSRLRRVYAVALGATALAVAGPPASAGAAAQLDLHSVNWSSVTLPAVCGGSLPIKLHRPSWTASRNYGTADVTPIPKRWSHDSFYGRKSVEVDTGPPVYGSLANGAEDAGLRFDCNNGGGTADGALLYGWVIFSGSGGKLSVVGVVTPRVQPAGVLPTLLEIEIEPGRVVAHEFYYGPDDPTCCPSGRATTPWTYSAGRLAAGAATITHRPTGSTSHAAPRRCRRRA